GVDGGGAVCGGGEVFVVGIFFFVFVLKGGGEEAVAVFARSGGEDGVDDFVFADQACGHVREQGAVVPEVDPDAVCVGGGEELARVGKSEGGAGA
ncbi:MAG: hypothetical protein Q9190_007217, partial [Brigantiaea leucoxantha]